MSGKINEKKQKWTSAKRKAYARRKKKEEARLRLPVIPQWLVNWGKAEVEFKHCLETYCNDPTNMNLFGVTMACRLLQRTHGDGAEDAYNELVGLFFNHRPPEKTQPVYVWKEQLGLYQKWLNGEFKI